MLQLFAFLEHLQTSVLFYDSAWKNCSTWYGTQLTSGAILSHYYHMSSISLEWQSSSFFLWLLLLLLLSLFVFLFFSSFLMIKFQAPYTESVLKREAEGYEASPSKLPRKDPEETGCES